MTAHRDKNHQAGSCSCCGQRKIGVDVHAHYYPESYLNLLEAAGVDAGVRFDRDTAGPRVKIGSMFAGPIRSTFIDIDERIHSMDEQGVSVQALSLTQPMVYWAPDDLSKRLSVAFNDALVSAHEAHPARLFGLAILPMHKPELAIAELDRVAGLPGIRGVYMATCILDKELSAKEFWPVYERIEDLGLPIFLHPVEVIGMEDRLTKFFLSNLLGNPFDTAIAASHLIFGGVLDRFPRLQIVLPHGGGAFPFLLGRIEHGWSVRPECRHLERSPREYLPRFYYDTITHSPEALGYLIDLVGPERVLLGSDYCFDMGYERPVDVIETHAGLEDAARQKILRDNAVHLLSLDTGGTSSPSAPPGNPGEVEQA